MNEIQLIENVLKESVSFVREQYAKRRNLEVFVKKHENDVLTLVDLAVQEDLVEKIKAEFPTDQIVGEESGLDFLNTTDPPKRCWFIDPIDGTQNFLRGQFPAFGISVGFVKNGVSVAGGVVFPISGDLFTAETGGGAYKNDERISVSTISHIPSARIDIDFDALQRRETALHRSTDLILKAGQIRSYSCAVVGFCQVAAGEQETYLLFGANSWDIAAGQIIVEEAGGLVTRLDGETLRPFDGKTGAIVANRDIHPRILDHLVASG